MRLLSSRGTSVLAALLLVAAFSTVIYIIGIFNPEGKAAQTAATLVPIKYVNKPAADTPPESAPAESPTVTAKDDKKGVELKGDARCNAPIEVKKDKKASGPLDGMKGVETVCVKGCTYKIYPGKPSSIQAKDTCADPKLSEAQKKSCKESTDCRVYNCESGNCVAVGGTSQASKDKILGKTAQLPEYFKDDPEVKKVVELAKTDPIAAQKELSKLDPVLQEAFEETKTAETVTNHQKMADNLAAIENLGTDDPYAKRLQEENAQLQQQNANLNKVNMDKLAQDQVALQPGGSLAEQAGINDIGKKNTDQSGDLCAINPSLCDKFGKWPPNDPSQPGKDDYKIDGKCSPDGSRCTLTLDTRDTNSANELKKIGYRCAPGPLGVTCTNIPAYTPPPGPRQPTGPTGPVGPGAEPCRITSMTPLIMTGNCSGNVTSPGNTFGGQGNSNPLGSFMNGLQRGFQQGTQQQQQQKPPPAGNQNPYPNGTCLPTYTCSNNTVYFRNSQCVDQVTQTCQYGCNGTQCATSPQTQCPTPPQQPDPAACKDGTWQQQTTTISTGQTCVTGYQCVKNQESEPTAQLSCQPPVIDLGMTVSLTFACGNATSSVGTGFSTGGALSGSTTTVISSTPSGSNSVNFGLACSGPVKTARAQCTVQVAKPSIVLVANPKTVPSGGAATIGWVTSGMTACVVSSPDLPDFTAANARNTSVNGMASTSPLTKSATFLLRCTTAGGNTKDATTTVSVTAPTGPVITVRSSFDNKTNITHGSSASIEWRVTNATTTNVAVALWLIDVQSQQSVALIAGKQELAGTHSWAIPAANAPCPADTPYVCGRDVLAGHSYAIQASVYTPADAYLGGYPPPNAVQPNYLGSAIANPFIVVQ